MQLQELDGSLAVCRLRPDADTPPLRGPLCSIVRTETELSLVCTEADAPADAQIEPGWCAFSVIGPLDFSLTGVVASLATPLAGAGVSVFVISSFDTDFVLVRIADRERARAVLETAGHEFV